MNIVAIVFGGESLEHDISIITGLFACEEFEKNKINYLPIYLDHQNLFYTGKALLNKDNYLTKKGFIRGQFVFKNGCYKFKAKHHFYNIECAVLCVHGKGMEDGKLKALFEVMHIPSTSSSVVTASLIQDKHLSKLIMQNADIPVIDSFFLKKGEELVVSQGFDYPLIVKPTNLGSSIGVKKVYNLQELKDHLLIAFNYDESVIVEKVVENLEELNIAILGDKNDYVISDIEMVNSKDDVLSFSDKYELFQTKTSGHIIPAQVSNDIKDKIINYASKAFLLFDCKGVVRFDFMLNKKTNEVYLNEINSIPGSLAFYLFKTQQLAFIDILKRLIEIAKDEYHSNRSLINRYEYSSLNRLIRKK